MGMSPVAASVQTPSEKAATDHLTRKVGRLLILIMLTVAVTALFTLWWSEGASRPSSVTRGNDVELVQQPAAPARGSAFPGLVICLSLVGVGFLCWSVHRLVARFALSATGSPNPGEPVEQVHARAAELTQLSRHLIRVAEEDKADFARELHDTFGSNLTAINMDLNWIAKRLPADRPELKERLQRALGMLSGTVKSTQDTIDRLRPSQLDNLGLAVALRSDCRDLAQRVGLSCQFNAAEDFDALDRMQSITLYRVAQEALANVEKHAQAAAVEVGLKREARGIRLCVWDDGIGLPEELSAPSHGMVCMRERIEALGGTLQITSARERGTRVDAFVPT